ncbi:hypothetical protein RSAG8_12957, partial [Rhizoctonia solani AG-8 WAC10335]
MGWFTIVTWDALPDCFEYLQNPLEMSDDDITILMKHLRMSEGDELPEAKRFQFSEPQPGWPVDYYLHHQPLDIRDNGTQPRRDGLPLFSSQVEPYLSFSREDIGMWEQALGDSDSCIALFHALEAHDHARPIHASPDHWAAIIRTMPHLKDTLPGEQGSIEQLRETKGWLPVEFYCGAHGDNVIHRIAPILESCNASNFYHARSKTLKGGPLGCKWAVLMLAHVLRNARLVREHNPMVDAHYGTMLRGVEFLDTYIKDLCNTRGEYWEAMPYGGGAGDRRPRVMCTLGS